MGAAATRRVRPRPPRCSPTRRAAPTPAALLPTPARPRDDNGALFLDRDGAVFRLVLSWLRTGVLPAQRNELAQRELLAEARWLQMDTLVAALEAELEAFEPKGQLLREAI